MYTQNILRFLLYSYFDGNCILKSLISLMGSWKNSQYVLYMQYAYMHELCIMHINQKIKKAVKSFVNLLIAYILDCNLLHNLYLISIIS